MLSALIKVSFGSGQQSVERKVTGQSAENKRLVLSPITHPHARVKAERTREPANDGGCSETLCSGRGNHSHGLTTL